MILIFLVMAGLVYVGVRQLGLIDKINLGTRPGQRAWFWTTNA
jgi:hypothetical protein